VVTTTPRRGFNNAVTRFWSLAAPAYDARFVQRGFYRPAQDEMISQLRTHGSRRVADIACGTGILADRIERELHPDQVYGVDMSEGMLAQAKARSSSVRWLRGPAEQLPFDDGALDAVVTTSAFHFFDQPAALREFHRVLAPGGFAAVATISPSYPAALERLSASLRTPAHHPSPPEMRELFEGAGFTVSEQHRVRRPLWTQFISDVITVGMTPAPR
jgi:ubiquinone/menaquinone biosynthesis C-methylase UbiE